VKGEGNVTEFVEFKDVNGWTHTVPRSAIGLHRQSEVDGGVCSVVLVVVSEEHWHITPAAYADLRAQLLGQPSPGDPNLLGILRGYMAQHDEAVRRTGDSGDICTCPLCEWTREAVERGPGKR